MSPINSVMSPTAHKWSDTMSTKNGLLLRSVNTFKGTHPTAKVLMEWEWGL